MCLLSVATSDENHCIEILYAEKETQVCDTLVAHTSSLSQGLDSCTFFIMIFIPFPVIMCNLAHACTVTTENGSNNGFIIELTVCNWSIYVCGACSVLHEIVEDRCFPPVGLRQNAADLVLSVQSSAL